MIGFGQVKSKLRRLFVREMTEEERSEIDIRIDTRFAWDEEDQLVTTEVEVQYLPLEFDETDAEPLIQLVLNVSVQTKGLADQLASSDDLPMGVRATVLGIALGTARGIIKVHSADFPAGVMELPVINPSDLLEGKLTREAREAREALEG